jgi:hypothetical protein
MAHWPKTVRGNLLTVLLIVAALAFLAQVSVALSGTVVWTFTAVAALTTVAIYAWHRRAQTARDVAAVDAPSFGDVLRRRHAGGVAEL